jgi:hypothetical protein
MLSSVRVQQLSQCCDMIAMESGVVVKHTAGWKDTCKTKLRAEDDQHSHAVYLLNINQPSTVSVQMQMWTV